MKSESVASHPPDDWDGPYRAAPSSAVGEFSRRGANPMVVGTEPQAGTSGNDSDQKTTPVGR